MMKEPSLCPWKKGLSVFLLGVRLQQQGLCLFLMDHQLELGIRALQAAQLINQEPMFWSMQGSISADSFGHYRLELAVDLTEEEGD